MRLFIISFIVNRWPRYWRFGDAICSANDPCSILEPAVDVATHRGTTHTHSHSLCLFLRPALPFPLPFFFSFDHLLFRTLFHLPQWPRARSRRITYTHTHARAILPQWYTRGTTRHTTYHQGPYTKSTTKKATKLLQSPSAVSFNQGPLLLFSLPLSCSHTVTRSHTQSTDALSVPSCR